MNCELDCEQARIELASHALGGLDLCDTEALEGHLRECLPCRAESGEYAEVLGVMATVGPWEIPAGVRMPDPGRAIAALRATAGRNAWGPE